MPMRMLNCDLGEGEPVARTRALLRWADLANVACGVHAGDVATMNRTLEMAKHLDVRVGAHPGLPGNFGRTKTPVDADSLRATILYQTAALQTLAARISTELHHVKLHGALYHQVESSPELAAVYLETISTFFPRLAVIAFADGEVVKIAPALGVHVLREAFAERGYQPNGQLIPRGQPGDVLTRISDISAQLRRIASGRDADTICVHSDHPQSVRVARHVARWLRT